MTLKFMGTCAYRRNGMIVQIHYKVASVNGQGHDIENTYSVETEIIHTTKLSKLMAMSKINPEKVAEALRKVEMRHISFSLLRLNTTLRRKGLFLKTPVQCLQVKAVVKGFPGEVDFERIEAVCKQLYDKCKEVYLK